MRRRPLGRTGVFVTELCLGTMTFGKEADEQTSGALLDRYVEAGGNFVDTADVYQHGESEQIIGRWLSKRSGDRDDVVLATKCRFPMGDDVNDSGLSRRYVLRACEASLRRLQTDHIDLYQAHGWDPRTPLEETLAAYDDLVRAGKVRYVGVSNFTGWQLQRAVLLARLHGWPAVQTLQPSYSLLSRAVEWELVPLCLDEGVGILPWGPLGGGWLAGKYSRTERPTGATRLGEDPGRGVEAYDKRNTDRTWAVVDAVAEVAERTGATPSQVSLRWVTDRPGVTSTILGARNVAQLEDNLAAARLRLDETDRARLDEVSAPATPDYPYELLVEMAAR